MFKRRTLFVVGAGASAEADLPVGETLASRISVLLSFDPLEDSSHPGMQLLSGLYTRYPLSDNGYTRAAAHISRGVIFAKSIDDFMDRHSSDVLIQLVGKAAIAKSILDAERGSYFCKYQFGTPDMFLAIKNSWYIRFFRMLGSDIKLENVKEIFDNVSFLVFNYDRCLEHFLENALQLVYGIELTAVRSIIEDIDIVHPYGIVAPLYGGRGSVPFGAASPDYAMLINNLKIYTEQHASGEVLNKITEMMSRAQQIAFLGFGYHEQNLTLLTPANPIASKPVFGTAKGWSDNDRDEVHGRLARMFKAPPARLDGKSPIVIDTKVSCAELFDSYGQSLTGR